MFKYSKHLRWSLLIATLFSMSSCFQFIEEISLNANGSGSMKLTLNMSQSKSKLSSIMLMDSINGHKVPDRKNIEQYMNETVSYLEKSEGIHSVTKSVDLKNYILTVNLKFTDVTKLNAVIKKLMAKQKTTIPTYNYRFDLKSKTFSRQFTAGKQLKTQFKKLQSKDQGIFKTATHTSIFRFQQAISATKNKSTKVSASGKAAMQSTNAMEIINGTADLSQSIQLK